MKVKNKEIILMNKIVINAIEHGGDVAPYFENEKNLRKILTTWLNTKGLNKDFKISQSDWCFIIPIDEDDIVFPNQCFTEQDNTYYINWGKANDKEQTWYKYFIEYRFDEDWENEF